MLGGVIGGVFDGVDTRIILLERQMEKNLAAMEVLSNEDMPDQVAFLMLRGSIALKMNYLCRVAPPSICEPAMGKYADRIYNFLETKFGLEKLSLLHKKQITMPQRHGGWGMRISAELNKIQFVASFIGALPHLSGVIENRHLPIITEFMSSLAWIKTHVAERESTASIKLKLLEMVPETLEQVLLKFGRGSAVIKIQHLFTESFEKSNFSDLMASPDLSNFDRARLHAVSEKHASVWMSVLPTHSSLRVTNDAFQIAVKMNLGQTPTAQSGLGWCHMCRKKVDGDPYHGFVCVCETRRTRNAGHDRVKHLIANTCNKFGLTTGVEPNVYGCEEENSGARPDLISYDLPGGIAVVSDVTISHPTAPSYIRHGGPGLIKGKVTKNAEVNKLLKHKTLANTAGYKFTPLALTTFGGMGRYMCDFLKLCDKAVENQLSDVEKECEYPRSLLSYTLIKLISIANLRSNAQIVMTCASRSYGVALRREALKGAAVL